ncbi:MAG: hypothetical protein IKF17_01665 [Clostridia bacterium]|nr:hypothetical protein [Clostridia bacterium]
MSQSNKDFKEKYKLHPVRAKAVSDFKSTSNFSFSKDVRLYMYQFMATIGLELEKKFPKIVAFDDNNFRLFGREKSEKSTDKKKELNIEDYDKSFKAVYESGNMDSLPTKVRPIYDYYAFKLVCPEIKDPQEVINTVIMDVLTDIQNNHSEQSSHISKLKDNISVSHQIALDYIDANFLEEYPDLKNKIISINNEQTNANDIKVFLESTNFDIENSTYSDYYSKIIECYQILIKLAYEESYEEYVRIAQAGIDARDELSELVSSGESDDKIDPDFYEEYSGRLKDLLEHISRKRTNKLDLALGDLMIYDVLLTSKKLKELGVDVSKDPTRTKKKRKPNGYIADFYSLDMPDGLTSEIQLQSAYRYTYGESGPAAHNKMENGIKKRTLYQMPKEKSKYKDWAEKQFKMLPKYFRYLGHGFIQVYNTLQNFRRYYDTENQEEVQTYVKYIAEHDVDQLDSDILHFSLDDESKLINIKDDSTR